MRGPTEAGVIHSASWVGGTYFAMNTSVVSMPREWTFCDLLEVLLRVDRA